MSSVPIEENEAAPTASVSSTPHRVRGPVLAVTVGVLAVAGAGISGVSSAATVAAGPITGIGGACLDVTGGSAANGTRIQLWTCNGGAAQQWTAATDGSISALGKCLDVAGAATTDGGKVQLYDCNGSGAQHWTASAGRLVNAGSGKCLDAAGRGSANGTLIQIWSCTGAANQQWSVATAPAAGPCAPGAVYGNPLPAKTLAATRIKGGFNFLEGPAWDATTQTLKLTNMHDGTGPGERPAVRHPHLHPGDRRLRPVHRERGQQRPGDQP